MKFLISPFDSYIEKENKLSGLKSDIITMGEEELNMNNSDLNSIPHLSKVAFKNGATIIILKDGNFKDVLHQYNHQDLSLNQDSKILAN